MKAGRVPLITDWLKLLTAALGGGLTVKFVEILYQEVRRRSEHSRSAKQFVDQHLDPLLKAADELVGKLRSLADEDFKSLRGVDPNTVRYVNHDFTGLLFLLAKLWANIEIIRHESVSVRISTDKRGKGLQSFIDCMESRRIRLVDRISQRAIGESILDDRKGALKTISFVDFVQQIESDPDTRRWVAPATRILSRTQHTSVRQMLLQYGAVVHAMIDTLDPQHHVTRNRPSYPHKLSKKSWRALKYRVFGQYLEFIPEPSKYLGPPREAALA